jgi:hypothetical protein
MFRQEFPAIFENSDQLDYPIQTPEPLINLTDEEIARLAGRFVMIAMASEFMPGGVIPVEELATLKAAMGTIEAGDAAKFRENAQNN